MSKHYTKESEGLGCIDEMRWVNDSAAEFVEGFAPTRFELEQLARYYFDKAQDITLIWEVYGQADSRQLAFCWRRLDTIANALGEEGLRSIIEPLNQKWQMAFQKAREEKEAYEALVDGAGLP